MSDLEAWDARAVLITLERSEFDVLFADVTVQRLRSVLKETDTGRRIQRTLLRGFRPDKVSRDLLMQAYFRGLSEEGDLALAAHLLGVWAGSPDVQSASKELLGDGPLFAAPLAGSIVDRLRVVVAPEAIAVLTKFAGPREETISTATIAVGVVDPAQSAAQDLEEDEAAGPEGRSMLGVVPVFDGPIDRDIWAWNNERPECVGDDDRLLGMADVIPSLSDPMNRAAYSANTGQHLESHARFHEAAAYYLDAARAAARANANESALSSIQAFVRARALASGGVAKEAGSDDLSELVADALEGTNAGLHLAVSQSVVALAAISADLTLAQLDPRARTALSSESERPLAARAQALLGQARAVEASSSCPSGASIASPSGVSTPYALCFRSRRPLGPVSRSTIAPRFNHKSRA